MKLVGRIAIVTGGSTGIGYSVADHLMTHGADVVITSCDENALASASASLTAAHGGRRALGVVCDAKSSAQIERLFQTVEAELGPAAIVVNNAGNSTLDVITNLPEEDWDSVVDTHLKGTFLTTKAAIIQMKRNAVPGAIVNIGSVETYATTRGNAHYTAAKAGVKKFTEVAALEAGRFGIRVNSVSPGAVVTPMSAEVTTPEFEAAWHETFAINRMGEPADIAKAVLFLVSDSASWITGIDMLVDGGTHLRGLPDYVDLLIPGVQ